MTATATPPAEAPSGPVGQPSRPARRNRHHDDPTATSRTLHALLASGLGAIPLKGLLQDYGWLIDVWLSMVVVMGPALLLRMRRSPGAADIWPGIVLLVPWLTVRFLPQHAIAGLIPTSGSVHDLSALMDSLHRTTTDGVAPVHSTAAVRLVLCALLGLLAALIDLIAVVGHRGALAGVPLLVVYTVAGAVPRQPVSWLWFIAAAIAYLLLLSVDAGDQLNAWGRRIGRPVTQGMARARIVVPVSAQRIGVLAILVAIVLPLIVPDRPRNLIANAFHHSSGGSGNGSGSGFGAGGSISPFARLKGDLVRDKPVPLFTVRTHGERSTPPFYLRANVLPTFTGDGWVAGDEGTTSPLGDDAFRTDPISPQPSSRDFTAQIKILRSIGNPAIFALPTQIDGVDSSTKWSERDQLLIGPDTKPGQTYEEHVSETTTDEGDLNAAPPESIGMERWLALPTIPSSVSDLVKRIIDKAGATTPYEKAYAIDHYFVDPANHFRYSLSTKKGDSGNDLVDFLKSRTGFCQQYAAAMAVMLRLAKLPARVVLGYMLPAPANGVRTVTSFDAHAWVEMYFGGIGWVPFDPTPTEGLDGGAPSDLGYARHPQYPRNTAGPSAGNPQSSAATSSQAKRTSAAPSTSATSVATGPASTPTDRTPLWVALGAVVVLLIGLSPAATRALRRRRRLAAARYGDPDPLWAELSDTAIDLGYVWSPARTPRQVAAWLAKDAHDPAALTALASAVEAHRYGPGTATADTAELARGLRRVTSTLRAGRSGGVRARARFWPASLNLGKAVGRGARLPRRH